MFYNVRQVTEYVLAVRRDCRETVPEDWVERVRLTRGVAEVREGVSARRILIRASDEAIGAIQGQLGGYLIVESRIPHVVAR